MKNCIIYIFTAAIVFFVIFFFVTPEQTAILKNLKLFDILISVVIALLIFSVSGTQFSFILKRTTNMNLTLTDRIFFPAARNLWSYIIPVQGSLAYSIAFAKFKYKASFSDSLSLNIYLLLFNFFFAGIVGILYIFQSNNIPVLFFIFCLLMCSIPILIIFANKILKNNQYSKDRFYTKIISRTISVSSSITFLWKDIKFSAINFALSVLHTLFTAFWIYWTVVILELDIDFLTVIFLSLILKVSLVFKLTPGNLGIEQLIFGGLFSMMNYDPQAGVLISLFNKSITLFISLTAGSIFTIVNLKYFKIRNINSASSGQDIPDEI
ncbi:MAG: lysylphosphatidylglycerol synthase domain-containing protein [Candidatus Delongbacteria bacterium]|jgi:hypothetical protein|nr:lysylphosphatidylglycerol synthase domain-containing protein [Candidatus Delongbacteria bacterium]MDY0016710.1 lysylphosphatidylglycerol synthase domain-containing protein [Candidatus Delongbacteria bacterium]